MIKDPTAAPGDQALDLLLHEEPRREWNGRYRLERRASWAARRRGQVPRGPAQRCRLRACRVQKTDRNSRPSRAPTLAYLAESRQTPHCAGRAAGARCERQGSPEKTNAGAGGIRATSSVAGVPGLEPRLTGPEPVGLPITPYPMGSGQRGPDAPVQFSRSADPAAKEIRDCTRAGGG